MKTQKTTKYDWFTTSDGRLWRAKRPAEDADWTPEQKRFARGVLAGMGAFVILFAVALYFVVRWEIGQ